MYFFYAVVMAPFLVMGIALILGDILYAGTTRDLERRTLASSWCAAISHW